jgi:hypothetical protein
MPPATSGHRQMGTVRAARADRKNWPWPSPAGNASHHRGPGACRAVTVRRIARALRSGRPGAVMLDTGRLSRHRGIEWPREIPESGISHRNSGSGPRSGTEAGDISPVSAVLEYAAGDFTTLGTDPSLECSSPPSDTGEFKSPGTNPGTWVPTADQGRLFCQRQPNPGSGTVSVRWSGGSDTGGCGLL